MHGEGPTLEGRARALYRERDFAGALAAWEDAYSAYRADADGSGAVRIARTLAGMYGTITGDIAVMQGWLRRAQTLISREADSAESGWVSLTAGMFESDRDLKHQLLHEACDVGREHGDADLEFTALAYLGASLVHDDLVRDGMALLDESLAAVAGGEVDDVSALEEIFCQLFAACERAHDVRRAEEWIRVGESVAQRRGLPAVSAFCHTHYGAVLTAAGRWPEAEATLIEAMKLWDLGQRAGLRRGAVARLAELRVRQGRIDEAGQLLTEIPVDSDTACTVAAMYLARGDTGLARDAAERALLLLQDDSAACCIPLALLVDVDLAEGRVDDAAKSAARLSTLAARHTSVYLSSLVALAQGRVHRVAGSSGALDCLRVAVAGFVQANVPLELARARLELAQALAEDHPDVALVEAREAFEVFDQLRAARHADAAVATLRALGVRPSTSMRAPGLLTKREAEVLELLGLGLSNPEISDRLFISRKTVEHHVGNILAKLGLRSRAEAAAHSVRTSN